MMSCNWSEITGALSNLEIFYEDVNGPGSYRSFNCSRKQIIDDWVVVENAVDKYLSSVV